MKKILFFTVLAFILASCGAPKVTTIPPQTIPLSLSKLPPSNIYVNMDYGIRLNVADKRSSNAVLSKYDVDLNITRPVVSTYPEVVPFVSESIKKYMQTMGFDIDSDINYTFHWCVSFVCGNSAACLLFKFAVNTRFLTSRGSPYCMLCGRPHWGA